MLFLVIYEVFTVKSDHLGVQVSQTRVRRKLISGKFVTAGSVDGQAMMVRLVWLAWGLRLAS